MNDSYQAIYDAVRSRISGGNIDDAVRDTIWRQFDISLTVQAIKDELLIVASEQRRPFVLLRPSIQPDGNQWCALYGENLHDGVAGFGDTPELASYDFDKNWREQTLQAAAEGK